MFLIVSRYFCILKDRQSKIIIPKDALKNISLKKMVMNLITSENLTRTETCAGLGRKYIPETLKETISIHTHG